MVKNHYDNPVATDQETGPPVARLASRDRIIAAANALHQRRPAQVIRVADIARAADVSPSLIIAHFKSKEELLFEAHLSWLETKMIPDVLAWAKVHPDSGLIDVLMHFFQWVGDPLHRSRDMLASSYWWTAPETQRYGAVIEPLQALVIQTLQAAAPHASAKDLAIAESMVQANFEMCLRAAGIDQMPPDDVRRLLHSRCEVVQAWLNGSPNALSAGV